jgi:hypothetical protein
MTPMNNEFAAPMPNPKENNFDVQRRIFTPGMLVIIQGIPFMSKGMKGNNLILRPITDANKTALENKIKRTMKETQNAK